MQIGQELKKPSKPVLDPQIIIPLIRKTNWENCILFPTETSLLEVSSHNKEKPNLALVFFYIIISFNEQNCFGFKSDINGEKTNASHEKMKHQIQANLKIEISCFKRSDADNHLVGLFKNNF